MALKVSEDALDIDELLRRGSATAVTQYAHLEGNAKKREILPQKKKPAGNWQEKIEKMRETHPNAYRPWGKQDDESLKVGFRNGATIEELSKLLGRHEGSIKLRLQKHFGEDTIV